MAEPWSGGVAEPPVAIVIADRDGVITGWTDGAAELFGHAPADAVGATLDLIVPDEFRARHWNGFRRAIANGKANIEGVSAILPVLCADGAVRSFAGRLGLLRDPLDAVIGAMAVYVPVTEGASAFPRLG